MGRRTWGLAAVLLLAVGGCTHDPGRNQTSVHRTGPSTMAPELTGANASYAYTLRSRCGERDGLGTFRVTVRHGAVTRVEPADRFSRLPRDLALVPTLDGFLAEADRATSRGADRVALRMATGGYPRLLSIDWLTSALDDELCWFASRVDSDG